MELLNVGGHDFEQAIETFAQNYSLPSMMLTPSSEKFEWRHRVSGDSVMTFRSTRIMATFETEVGAAEDFVVQWGKSGQVVLGTGRSSTPVQIDIPLIAPNGRSTLMVRGTDVDLSLVHISKDFVRNVAEELDGVQFITFNSGPSTSAQALRAWRSTVNLAALVVLDADTPATSLLIPEINRLVAVSMLDSFSYISAEQAPGIMGNEPRGVREAYEFVNQNAHLPIGPIDIAKAARLSVRSLQHALRRYRDTTPTAMLRSVRLSRVHDELQSSEPALASVTEIARRWGFIQMGRFAGDYRAQFGVSPSDTLRRSSRLRSLNSR